MLSTKIEYCYDIKVIKVFVFDSPKNLLNMVMMMNYVEIKLKVNYYSMF